jgi:hypothetical protein
MQCRAHTHAGSANHRTSADRIAATVCDDRAANRRPSADGDDRATHRRRRTDHRPSHCHADDCIACCWGRGSSQQPGLDKSVATIADAISLSSPSYDTWALPATATADDIFKFYADKLKQAGWTDTGKAGQNPTFGKYTVWQSNDKKSGLVVLYLPNADPTKPTVALAILGTIKTASATATVAPTTAPASPVAPPGLYATAMRLEPAQPAHSQATSFFVTFLNTATTDNNQRWAVYIYKADNLTRRNNETTVLPTTFQPGSVELKSIGTFQIGSTGNPCDYFSARVVTLDQNNKGIELTKPDGTVFEKGFAVCQ